MKTYTEFLAHLETLTDEEFSANLRATLMALPYQDDDGVVRGTVADHVAKVA